MHGVVSLFLRVGFCALKLEFGVFFDARSRLRALAVLLHFLLVLRVDGCLSKTSIFLL